MEVSMANQVLANSPAGGPVQGEGGLFALKASDSSAAGYGVVGITAVSDVLGDMRGTSPLDPTRLVAGVYGISDLPGGSNAGVLGENFQDGPGVLGKSNANDGVQGIASQTGRSGVTGINSGGGNGVFGQSESGRGVAGTCNAGVGVFGEANQGDGVQGNSNAGAGVAGASVSGTGVHGANHSASETAVFGINDTPGQQVPPNSKAGAGSGVWGHTRVEKGAGVVGTVEPGLSQATGVVGIGPTEGRFVGNVEVKGNLLVDRDVHVTGDVFLEGGKDLAEEFEVGLGRQFEPGTLMVIGENGTLAPSASAYDKRAIGVISGAGALKPAITLGQAHSLISTVPIALVGTVFCRASAEEASIEAGDLLTSSDVPGHAMKALDHGKSFGAIVGKALTPLCHGRGLIPIVIALH